MKNLSIAAILGCFLVAGYCCIKCDAQIANPGSTPPQGVTVSDPAEVLVRQLSARTEVRDAAAKALQSMGRTAASALAGYITKNIDLTTGRITEPEGVTKAITVLAKIGKDVADDEEVRKALVSAAKVVVRADDWPRLQLQLAAIDALGEINKYRGILLTTDDDDPMDTFDPAKALAASETLAEIADGLFKELLGKRYDDIETATTAAPVVVVMGGAAPTPTPTPTPTPKSKPTPPIPTPRDTEFYDDVSVLHDAQTKLLELADQAAVAASSPKESAAEPAFTKLADAKSLAASLKKIEVAYLDATKTVFAKKATDQADDKSHWQLKTEAAYDLLTETTQLRDELDSLSDFTVDRADLAKLLSELVTIPAANPEVKAAVANAINGIFSKPPQKTPAAETAKKDTKDGEKKDTDKKDDAATKDKDKEKSKSP